MFAVLILFLFSACVLQMSGNYFEPGGALLLKNLLRIYGYFYRFIMAEALSFFVVQSSLKPKSSMTIICFPSKEKYLSRSFRVNIQVLISIIKKLFLGTSHKQCVKVPVYSQDCKS